LLKEALAQNTIKAYNTGLNNVHKLRHNHGGMAINSGSNNVCRISITAAFKL
jgi:hypothetical protein